ncbi:MAG: type VI secretion system ATPase TssH, partial [Bacilli bacterium]|nr:type VI secretion system ATPase TssH [Bacilli bacterium]
GNTSLVLTELKQQFRPEFINRIDEIIVFQPLTKSVISEILDKIISDLETRLKDHQIHLELTESARDFLVENGFDPNYGARPLKRFCSRTIEAELSKMIIEDKVSFGMHLVIDIKNDQIIIYEKKEKE